MGFKESEGVTVMIEAKEKKRVTLQEEIMDLKSLEGFRAFLPKVILFWLLVLCTGGVLYLFYYWFEKYAIRIIYTRTDLKTAERVLVTGWDDHFEFPRVEPFNKFTITQDRKRKFNIHEVPFNQRMIVFKHVRYEFFADENTFKPIVHPELLADRYNKTGDFPALSVAEHESLLAKTGINLIDIPVPTIPILLFREVLGPFYIFQIYSAIVWCTEQYYIYSGIILFMALITAILGLWEVRQNLVRIREISRHICEVTVVRDNEEQLVDSTSLVPGDIVVMRPNITLPCDMIVLSGSCVVDESMLTGESTPVVKVAIPSAINPMRVDPRHVVFGGTRASEVRVSKGGKMTAVVINNGYQTSKGLLVLSILFPKPTQFKFVQESMKFLGVLFLAAAVGFAIVVYKLVQLDTAPETIVQRACDLITVVVPPALPMAASVGTAFAVQRLKKFKVFCVSLPRINLAGKINYMCFDKTGTLTEDGLDFMGALPTTADKTGFAEFTSDTESMPSEMKMGMMACHSLTHIDNKISGEALELKIFHATQASLEEPHVTSDFDNTYMSITRTRDLALGVLTQFEFIPQLQRMSVLITDLQKNNCYVITKGSPEVIRELAVKDSIPPNYMQELSKYTQQGYRVLAMGYRVWENQYSINMDKTELRRACEDELIFLGFIVMQNKLKPETAGALRELKRANIRSVMVTGDNILTAVCIAKQCEMIDPASNVFLVDVVENKSASTDGAAAILTGELTFTDALDPKITLDPATLVPSSSVEQFELAVTGKAFGVLLEDFRSKENKFPFEKIISGGTVWARMSPDNKAALVDELMALGWYTGMCGDGANDCIALRSAHVGVSLSQAEASVSAPFTSQIVNISCIPLLLREGRSALTTAFQLFRFMALYSMIQFTNVVLLNFNAAFLGNWQYLYQDLWVVFPLVVLMGRSAPAAKLTKKRPSGRLFSFTNLTTTFLHILITFAFQIALYVRVRQQNWFYNIDNTNNDPLETNTTIFECTTIWILAEFQYMAVSLMFTMERKFKQPIYTNYGFISWWTVTTVTGVLLLWTQQDGVYAWLQVLYIPYSWRGEIFWMSILNIICYIIVEIGFVTAKDRGWLSKRRTVRRHRAAMKEFHSLWSIPLKAGGKSKGKKIIL